MTMSSPFSFEHVAAIRQGARRMVERTRAHEGDLNQLVETAEGVARHATALAALTRTDADADGLSRLCADQARLSVENAAATVRACVSARERHVEAHRKATEATRESRVIAYTGNGSIPPPLERWFVAIVSKPSSPDVVLAAVQHAVSL
jgi:hypothetical protein